MVSNNESNLTIALNLHMLPFVHYTGGVPETVPVIRLDGRNYASGNELLAERLAALQSGDEARIEAWGNKTFSLSDLCVVFEDEVKFQRNSGFLTGIRGVVEAGDALYVAIDAGYVQSAVHDMNYFPVTESATVRYNRNPETQGFSNRNPETQQEVVSNVVLLPYDTESIDLSPDQYRAISVEHIKRKDMIISDDPDVNMQMDDIVRDGEVIHKAWAMYDADIIVPLVPAIFEFSKREYSYDSNMGVYLPDVTQNNAQVLPMRLESLEGKSELFPSDSFDAGYDMIGALEKRPEVAQKLAPWENELLTAARRGDVIMRTPDASYVKAAGPVQPINN